MKFTLLIGILCVFTVFCFSQHPADSYSVIPLTNLSLNRVATKLTPTQLTNVSPSSWGFRWNSGDNSTLNWRPQGITAIQQSGVNFMAVSWYGLSNQGYEDRGARISLVDLADENNLAYRHVLLVDENYNTFPDLHAGGIAYMNDTLFVADTRSGRKEIIRFDINKIKQVPSSDVATYYNYGFILQAVAVDTVPIKPSFLSYDWSSQELVTGSFNNCGTPYCANNASNTLAWQPINSFNINSPFYINFFGKMQGVASTKHINNNKKMVWATTSYGRSNPSYLYATSFNPGLNNAQSQAVSLGQNYNRFTFPPGLEDMYINPQSDTLWTLTEFGTNEGMNNNRDVFAIAINDLLPPGTCTDSIYLSQNQLQDDFICQIEELNYPAFTNYISYASFNSVNNNWINANNTANSLTNNDRSVFMWVRKASLTSTEVLCGINTSTGGNISNLQISGAGILQVYDGSTSHSGTTNIVDNQWHYVGYTYNNNTFETKVYVDGVEEASFVNSQPVTSTSQISLGQEFDSGNISNLFNGDLTEVSFWGTILSPAEIGLSKSNVIDSSHPKYASLIAHYSMNAFCGGDLTIISDESPNGFDGLASHHDILSLSNLSQIFGFNSAAYFSKKWLKNGSLISNSDTLTLSNYGIDNYTLVLNKNNIFITDNWSINYNIGIDTQTACNSYTWIDGTTYTSNNSTATYNILGGSSTGCDSLVTLDLTILNSTSGIDTQTACNSYTWIDGTTYTSNNNTATYNILGGSSTGCDSLVTLDLTIKTFSSTVTLSGATITSDTSGLDYQWIDCNNNYIIIQGEINQSYSAIDNGSFAVILSDGVCTDTSVCIEVLSLGYDENLSNSILCYPNPTLGNLEINLGSKSSNSQIKLYSIDGREVMFINEVNKQFIQLDLFNEPKGVYLLSIIKGEIEEVIKIIKE